MGESGRNKIPTIKDYELADTFNLGIDRLGKKSNSLRRVQAVQDDMFSKLEKKYDRRLRDQVKKIRPGRIFTEDYAVIAKSAENAKWYEEGAKIDLQTGLPTKLGLIDKLERIYAEIGRGILNKIVVLQFDLNGFKTINDLYSHSSGDQAIKLFSEALKGAVRSNVDIAVRKQAGGDEFFLVLELGEEDKDIDSLTQNVVGRIFSNVSALMKNENFKWDVLDENGKLLCDKSGNPIYAAKGFEVIDKNNLDQLTIDKLFESLEKKYKEEKKSLRLKKRS